MAETTATMAWRVYGARGRKQKESFYPSYRWDFTNEFDGVRIIEVENSDKTGTNDYSVVRITRNTFAECKEEMSGQITDGIFENFAVGRVIEVGA